MPIDEALAYWRGLRRLAGDEAPVHLAGGEPFLHWEHLLALCRAARDAGLTPIEKIETNAYWCTNANRVRERLADLKDCGLDMFVVSSDAFHQEFVPMDRVRLAVTIGRKILGKSGVRVRWRDWYNSPTDVQGLLPHERTAFLVEAFKQGRDRKTGRAASQLAPLLEGKPAEALGGWPCRKKLLGSRHVHIDPYGNVFSGVCTGIILGNAQSPSLDKLWEHFSQTWPQRPVFRTLVEEGPVALIDSAIRLGYEPLPGGYAGKCHLCTHVREFLFHQNAFPDELGPVECYSP